MIPSLSPQCAIFGFNDLQQDFKIINHLLLIFKFYVYQSRNEKQLNFRRLKLCITKVKNVEERLTYSNTAKKKRFLKKWEKIKSRFQ